MAPHSTMVAEMGANIILAALICFLEKEQAQWFGQKSKGKVLLA